MAQGSTVYVFDIELADADRGVYRPLELRVAQHASETEDHLLTRVLAYCFEYTEGISFSKGLADPDEPAIAIRDLTGTLQSWIDIGAPDAARLHRAGKAARRVAVYTHKDSTQLAARWSTERIHRAAALELFALDRQWLAAVTAKLARRMEFSLTVAEQHVYLMTKGETLSCVLERVAIAA